MTMKRNLAYIALGGALVLSSCSNFLDTLPDNRTEIDSADKMARLLVSAYPTSTYILLTEMASDNAMDNGSNYGLLGQEQEDSYLWRDITMDANDSPKAIWDSHYNAIAAANEVLLRIEEAGNPANLNPQKGEALLCRAYAHFVLANVFCMHYDPATAASRLGVPYSTRPETEVSPDYVRGTLAETYKHIQEDLEAGLPLIDDNLYSVPKYHFNMKAAYAFAARFYLYTQQWAKVISAADRVLGSAPDKVLRNWTPIVQSASKDVATVYNDPKLACNLLFQPSYSNVGYLLGSYTLGERYGHGNDIFTKETVIAYYDDNICPWGNLAMAQQISSLVTKCGFFKTKVYFEYVDKESGSGYVHYLDIPFRTDETLLCRAEAYAVLGGAENLDKALADINIWIKSHSTTKSSTTLREITRFYDGTAYASTENTTIRSIKKHLNPIGFTIQEGSQQESVLQTILHMRRIELLHDGLRWFDIKRYGIEVVHNRDNNTDIVLGKDDLRRAIQLPQDVIDAGLEANPR